LQAVDVTGVPPAVHAREEGNVLRADEAAEYPNR
jgi:Asp-tRNA(Asn)/Glu-tRNA(Gln) amidotransferase C subunit